MHLLVRLSPSKNKDTARRRICFLALGSFLESFKSCLDVPKFNAFDKVNKTASIRSDIYATGIMFINLVQESNAIILASCLIYLVIGR